VIDLHCHIVDGTGCGPADFAGSVALCRQAINDGVTTVVAAPRWAADSVEPPLPFANYQQKLDHLQHELQGALNLRRGFLLRYSPQLPALIERYGRQLTLNGGRYLLVSLPPLMLPADVTETWQALRRHKFSVVLARPECSPALRRQPAILEKWLGEGDMLQLDTASVVGAHGREVQSFALRFARMYPGQVVVASNTRGQGTRAPMLGAARELLIKALGARAADRLLSETPALILNTGTQQSKPRAQRPTGRTTPFWRTLRAAGSFNGWLF
jgi:protein-tyrosine phosphatase